MSNEHLHVLKSLRASALPLAFRCPGSLRPDPAVVQINPSHDAAADGTAAHECLQQLAERGAVDWETIEATAEKHGADPDEVRMLCAMGTRLWSQVKDSFFRALAEVSLATEIAPGVTLTGHVDLLATRGKVARAADWKTGRKDGDYSHQMRAYGALILFEDPSLTEVTVTVLWVRDDEFENYTMTREDARAWLKDLLDRVVAWDGVYRTGTHCPWCPRSHECEAFRAMIRRDVEAVARPELVARVEGDLAAMAPDEVVEVFMKADMVEKFAARVRDAIRRHVDQNGEIRGAGHRLTVVTETRREVDAMLAWPVLDLEGFEDEDFAAVMTMSASKIEKRIAEKAGRGNGAKAARAIAAKLDEARAIDVREIKKLLLKRV